MLGLPGPIRACLFDLDGVLTRTATVHAAAWKEMFDGFLRNRDGDAFRPFNAGRDYDQFVDGKPRENGVRDFLSSRQLTVPEGSPQDGPDVESMHGLGARKNEILLRQIREHGVEVYDGSVRYLKAARAAGLRRFVVSSSANTRQVLEATGLAALVEGRVDGVTLADEHLRGKPAPDSLLAGARLAGVEPSAAAVFDDAWAGVAAGRAAGLGYVVGVDRVGQADALREQGADAVVRDLAELLEGSP